MFNFKDQQIKITQNQNVNSIKNLRKELPKQSPFRYGSKKISFNVKNRSDYWDDIEKVYTNDQERINAILGTVIQNFMNGKDTDYDITDSVLYSPISPVLAVTLVMLNKALFRCQTFTKYMESDEAQVYAYTHWNGKNFVTDPTALVIDNPFGNDTEKYRRILPGYNNINIMNFIKGYLMYMKDYSSGTSISNDTAAVSNESKLQGSYNIDNKRFQRIFATKPDLDKCYGTVSNATIRDSKDKPVVTLNMHPEVDSYLYADGIFKKLMDSPYNSQSYQISVLRGGYGFGPINIACFLKAKQFNIERITDIISGLLISEDSGMPLIDAIKGIQEWRQCTHDNDTDTIFNSLSDIRILRFIEYIGSIFFTAILGSSLKEKPLINIPLTSAEKKIYDVGYLMGHNYDIFVQMFKNGIKNKIWLKDSTEIFSFEVPCVLYGTEPTTGIFKIGDYVKNYSDSLLLGSEPLDYTFGVSSILEKERVLSDYIIPQKGYTIFDFVTKGLNKTLIKNICKNIEFCSEQIRYFNNSHDDCNYVMHYQGSNISNLLMGVPIDFNIAPRQKNTITEDLNVDRSLVSTNYQTEYCTAYNISSYSQLSRIALKGAIVSNYYITLTSTDGEVNFRTRVLYVDSNYKLLTNGYYLLNKNDNNRYYVLSTTLEATPSDQSTITSLTKRPSKILCYEEKTQKVYELNVTYPNNGKSDNKYNYVDLQGNTRLGMTDNEIYNSLFLTMPGQAFNRGKVGELLGVTVYSKILDIFTRCGFYNFLNFTPTFEGYNSSKPQTSRYEDTDVILGNYINRFALCILKLSVINAFCMSYSIDLLSLPDSVRSFYDIYKSYLGDFIEIKQEIQN